MKAFDRVYPWLIQSLGILAIIPVTFSQQSLRAIPNREILMPIQNMSNQTMTDSVGIQLIQTGIDGMHAVQISQSFVGSSANGCDPSNTANNAMILFATYLDPDTLVQVCGLFEREVTPCFVKSVLIGCDAVTNTASINLYIRDETFGPTEITDNPAIDRCTIGTEASITRAIRITQTYDCQVSGPDGSGIRDGPYTCSDIHDNCEDGTYCNFSESVGYECKLYAPVGSQCGGYSIPGAENRCNPTQSYCFSPLACQIPDVPGICTAYEGDCTSNADCSEVSYCDLQQNRCKPQLTQGDCCVLESDTNSCAVGLDCKTPAEGGPGPLCLPHTPPGDGIIPDGVAVINGDPPTVCSLQCAKGELCVFSDVANEWECKPHANLGASCRGVGIPANEASCDPYNSFCQNFDSCLNNESTGTCVGFLGQNKCRSTADCFEGGWCDVKQNRCKPQVPQDACCNSTEECGSGYVCAVQDFGGEFGLQKTCRVICTSDAADECGENEWCSFNTDRNEPRFCKPYANEGDKCEGRVVPSFFERCPPDTHFCQNSDNCSVADKGGTCQLLGNLCNSTLECLGTEWCDVNLGRCKRKLALGFCCDLDQTDQCAEGTECSISATQGFGGRENLMGGGPATCREKFDIGLPNGGTPLDVGVTPSTVVPLNGGSPPNTAVPLNVGLPPNIAAPLSGGLPPNTVAPIDGSSSGEDPPVCENTKCSQDLDCTCLCEDIDAVPFCAMDKGPQCRRIGGYSSCVGICQCKTKRGKVSYRKSKSPPKR